MLLSTSCWAPGGRRHRPHIYAHATTHRRALTAPVEFFLLFLLAATAYSVACSSRSCLNSAALAAHPKILERHSFPNRNWVSRWQGGLQSSSCTRWCRSPQPLYIQQISALSAPPLRPSALGQRIFMHTSTQAEYCYVADDPAHLLRAVCSPAQVSKAVLLATDRGVSSISGSHLCVACPTPLPTSGACPHRCGRALMFCLASPY